MTEKELEIAVTEHEMPLLMMEDHPSRPRNRLIAQAFYDIHLIEHYGSGIRRIKDECDANGNAYPIWRDDLGTFSTTYLLRNASEGKNTVGEGINEGTNGSGDTINSQNGTINEGCGTINNPSGTINGTINDLSGTITPLDDTTKQRLLDTVRQKEGLKREALAELHSVSLRTVARLLADLEHEGKIIYRGSKKTGGYFAVKQED